jgi:hypothetical protein
VGAPRSRTASTRCRPRPRAAPPHKDIHNGNGETHSEWWRNTFYRHLPIHGFLGDIFTVNGTAYPVLEVKRRKYRTSSTR